MTTLRRSATHSAKLATDSFELDGERWQIYSEQGKVVFVCNLRLTALTGMLILGDFAHICYPLRHALLDTSMHAGTGTAWDNPNDFAASHARDVMVCLQPYFISFKTRLPQWNDPRKV